MSELDAAPRSPAAVVPARTAGRADVRTLVVNGLHLAALSSLAIAQPLFDLLGRQAAFFAVRGSTAAEIVAFALGVTLVPTLMLIALEALAGLLSTAARRVVHLASIGVLASLLALMAWKRLADEPAAALVAAAAASGAMAAVFYARLPTIRSILTVLSPAPLVVVALFLFFSPVAKLIFPAEAEARPLRVDATAPVVFLVFDEFSGTSLLDAGHEIDEVRYPNFARLARVSTWFRRATSVSPWTERAVPALLSGQYPGDRLPVARDYPRNLFTLLGGSHDLVAREMLTHICPSSLCRPFGASQIAPGPKPLLSDAGIVYLHVLLPGGLTRRLPSVTSRWGDFGGDGDGESAFVESPEQDFRLFLESIGSSARPRLYYLHVSLPHFPWHYLPSGKRYVGRIEEVPGLNQSVWGPDADLVRRGHQRYLLQVGFVDRLVGQLVARLRATGLYDRSLLVVTADHGISFRPNQPWRAARPANVQDLAFVPLFVKSPEQRTGRTRDDPVQTTDILPTVVDALGVSVPWRFDGRSALRRDGLAERKNVRFDGRRYDLAVLEGRRDRDLRERIRRFGAREPWVRAFAAGTDPRLLGRPAGHFPVTISSLRAEIDDESRFGDVDPGARILPAYVSGRVTGAGARAGRELAVAVNGSIVATAPTYDSAAEVRFAALVPETALRAGRNRIEVFEVSSARGRLALASLGSTLGGVTYALVRAGAEERIRSAEGRSIRIRRGALQGGFNLVRVSRYTNDVHFAGWAADVSTGRIRGSVLVFADGRFVSSVSAQVDRPDLQPGLREAGFDFRVPVEALAVADSSIRVRVFAVAGGTASELGCAHRAVRSGEGATLLLPTVCPSAKPSGGGERLVTRADLARYPRGSPGRALLVWWQSAQQARLDPYLRSFERSLRERLRRDAKTRPALLAMARALATGKPRVVDVARSGAVATVFTEIEFATGGTPLPRAFELLLQDDRWVLRDDFFVQSTIPRELRGQR